METLNNNLENQMSISRTVRFPTSVYAAISHGNKKYVGGSTWDRRNVPYTKTIAAETSGQLWICDVNYNEECSLQFPSMVYSIMPLADGRLFVGCKGTEGALNIMNPNGDIVLSRDDVDGHGVYNSLHDEKNGYVVCANRAGCLSFLNPETLQECGRVPLSEKNRLWSLVCNAGAVLAGDYGGNLFKYSYRDQQTQCLNLANVSDRRPEVEALIQQGFGPSVWGLDVLPSGQMVVGTRWKQLFVIDSNMQILKSLSAPESVTCLVCLSETSVLIGTRLGEAYVIDLDSGASEKVAHIPSSLQKENAVWGISKEDRRILLSIADGDVVELAF